MNTLIPILIIVLALAAAVVAALAIVVAGIHGDERHLRLSGSPRTRASAFARRMLGVRATTAANLYRTHADARR
jgi:hypothetical protein